MKEQLIKDLTELLTDCTEAELQALIDVVTQFSHEEVNHGTIRKQ